MTKYKRGIYYSLVLCVISFVLYLPSLDNKLVWDDSDAINKKHYKYQGFINLLTPQQKSKKGNYYRPTVYLSYFIDQTLWGNKPFGYHLSNLIFNTVTVILLFWFVYFFFSNFKPNYSSYNIAFISSLVFALHPMHVESVSWIAGRTDVLCTLFLLMGLLFHLKSYKKVVYIPFAILAFYLSLLSKELAVVFIPLVLLTDLVTNKLKNKNNAVKYILYLSIFILYMYLRSKSFVNITPISEKNVNVAASADILRYLDMFVVLVSSYYSYLYKLLFPIEFNAFISEVTKDLYYLVPSFIVLTLVFLAFIYSLIKRVKLIYYVIFWILISLGPSILLTLIKMTPTSLAERYLYLPSVAFAMGTGYLFYKYVFSRVSLRYSCVFITILVLFYALLNINRQSVWYDDLSLWSTTTVASSNTCLPYNNYGVALKRNGRIDEAIRQYEYVVNNKNIKCRDAVRALVYNNLGTAYIKIDQQSKGRETFKKAMELNEYYHSPHLNLGIDYLLTALETKSISEFEYAKQYFNNSISIRPNSGISHHYLSIAYKETGDLKNARIHASRALELGIPPAQKNDALRILDEIQNSDSKEN